VASIVLAGSALAAFAGATNGSFEDGGYTPNASGFEALGTGSSDLTGWAITGSIDWIGTYWPAAAGSKSLDMNGTGPGTISQILATMIGKTYVVSFSMSANPDEGATVKTLTVSATGTTSKSFTYDRVAHSTTRANMMWESKQYSFVATNASTTLTFASGEATGASGPALDNVVVKETGSSGSAGSTGAACKKGGWKTAVDGAGRHFKNQGDCVSYYATKGKNMGSGAR
jgi:choice-of-anchor C domain-containing protein